MSEGKNKKTENLEELDIEMSKILRTEDGEGPDILDSKKARAYASACGRCNHLCGQLVKSI